MKIKSKRLISFTAALALWLSSFSGLTVFAAGGYINSETDGQGNTVHLIEDLADFQTYIVNTNSYPYVKLSADIDISSLCSGDDGSGGTRKWAPIGDSSGVFTGTFDGNGHTISGIYINDNYLSCLGLFGENRGTIKNLTVSGNVTGGSSGGGGGYSGTGGICAINSGGTIENCVNEVTVTGASNVGGICGYNNAGSGGDPYAVNGIINCINKAAISGNDSVGGICGYNMGATVNKCRNDGAVTADFSGSAQNLGGICGNNMGNVENCFNTATLGNTGEPASPINGLGGICGNNNSGVVNYCFNVGGFAASEGAGGICGNGDGTINNTYYLKEAGDSLQGTPGADLEGQTTPLTADEFASGVVAHAFKDALLSAPGVDPGADPEPANSEFWGQTVIRDAYPMLTDNDSKRVYKVTFYSGGNGSTEVGAAYANSGGKVNLPDDPDVGSGYKFAGWSTSKDDLFSYEFTNKTSIIGDTSVYAMREELFGEASGTSKTIAMTQGTPQQIDLSDYVAFTSSASLDGTKTKNKFTYTFSDGTTSIQENGENVASITDDILTISGSFPVGTYQFAIRATGKAPEISAFSVSSSFENPLVFVLTLKVSAAGATKEDTPSGITIDYINETLDGFASGQNYKITNGNITHSIDYSGTPIAIAEDWIGKTVSIVRSGKGGNSDSDPLELAVTPARPNAPSVSTSAETAEGTGGRITGGDSTLEYKKSGDTSWTNYEDMPSEGLSAGVYSVRVKAVENVHFAGKEAQVSIDAYASETTRLPKPEAEINYANESIRIINPVNGATYTVGGKTITLNSGGEWPIPAISVMPGGAYGLTIVRKSNNPSESDSEPVNITIPARPAAPSGLSAADETEADKNDGKITGTDATMEYRKSAEEEWTVCPDADMTGLAPGTYYIRYKSTSAAFAGLAAELTVNAGAEPVPTDTPIQTATPTDKPVQTVTPTDTPVQTATPTDKPVQTTTPTDTPVQTAVPTDTPVQTATPTDKPVQTATPTDKPVQTATPTDTPVQTATPTDKPVQTTAPTEKPVQTTAPTDKPVQTATPTDKPVQTTEPTEKPVQTTAPTEKPIQTAVPTATPTVTPTPKPFEWNIKKTSSSITVKEPSDGFKYTVIKDGKELFDWKTSDNGKDITFSGLKSNTKYVVKARSVSDPAVEYTTEVKTNTSGGGGGGGAAPAKKTPTPKPAATPKPETTPKPEKTPEPSKMPAEQNPEDKPFTDISDEDWFAEDVLWANSNGIMTGILQTEFVPDMPLTRGMLAAILGRMENVESKNGKTPFADVDETMYYAPYIAWAYENGILHGMDDNLYCPDENITREQMAVAIKNYAEYKGRSIELSELNYTDSDRISGWAQESVAYCKAAGYMLGRLDGSFDPGAGLTRAECAAVIRRLY